MHEKEEEQIMNSLAIWRKGMEICTEVDAKTNDWAECEWKTIQSLPHAGMHPICNYKTQEVLWVPTGAGWSEPDGAVIWQALLVHDKCRGWYSQPAIELSSVHTRVARARAQVAMVIIVLPSDLRKQDGGHKTYGDNTCLWKIWWFSQCMHGARDADHIW